METITYSKKVMTLREQKYTVRPIRRKGGWVPSDHDSAFMNDGSKYGVVVPVKSGNVLMDPLTVVDKEFTDQDREALVGELGLPDLNSLNCHVQKNYWRGNTVFLDRNGLHLDLSKTDEFVQFLILRSDVDNIAPNWANRFQKGTYKFALCEEGEELVNDVSDLEDKKNAYIYIGKIDKSVDKMMDFLYVYYLTAIDAKRPPKTASVDWLKKEIGRIIEDDLKVYLQILDDDDYLVKLLIQRSVEAGALIKKKHYFSLPGSDSPIGVLEDTILFLEDSKNQEVRMKLKAQIDNVKGK